MPDKKPDPAPSVEPLLSRWSRLKKEAAAAPPPAEAAAPKADLAPVALPPVESLTRESDFSLFMQPQVLPELRQAALKKLFADPHFNVMDGLDIYIDDYTRPDPIAASIVSELTQFRNLDGLPQEAASADAADAEAPAESVCASAAQPLPDGRENGRPEPAERADGNASQNWFPLDIKSRSLESIGQFVPPDSD